MMTVLFLHIDLRFSTFYNKAMNIHELEPFLRKITKSEQYHLDNPDQLSPRYAQIKRIKHGDKEMFEFTFESLLRDENISIMKESRFTEIPLHCHKQIEINYVYSGQLTQCINDQKITLNTGDVCLLDRNTPHSIMKTGENDIIITIDMRKKYFTDGFLQKLSSQGIISKFLVNAIQDNTEKKQHIIFHTEDDEELRWMFQRMICEYYSEDKSHEVIDAYMIIILSKLLKIFKQSHFSDYKEHHSVLILDILQYLETNYMNVTLSDAAETFNFNPTYFGNYIKKYTGKTFKELIIQKKMTMACYYLVNTDMPIYQIVEEVGYENLGFFYKKFKDKYDITPQEYRDLYKND